MSDVDNNFWRSFAGNNIFRNGEGTFFRDKSTSKSSSSCCWLESNLFQFFHRPRSSLITLPNLKAKEITPNVQPQPISPSSLIFLTTNEVDSHVEEVSSSSSEPVFRVQNTFLACSENGFVLNQGQNSFGTKSGSATWSCKIPGGLAQLRWQHSGLQMKCRKVFVNLCISVAARKQN